MSGTQNFVLEMVGERFLSFKVDFWEFVNKFVNVQGFESSIDSFIISTTS